MAPFEHLVLGRWRRAAARSLEGDILEVGAGTGCMLRHYGRPNSVTLTERSAAMLRRARPRTAAAAFDVAMMVADGMELPFASGSFDSVVVSLALCTIPDPVRALSEIRRVLKPHGELRLLEHVRVDRPWVARLQDTLTPTWSALSDGCRLNQRTLETATTHGFRAVDVRTGLGGWLLLARLVADDGATATQSHPITQPGTTTARSA